MRTATPVPPARPIFVLIMLRAEATSTLKLAFPIIIGELAQVSLHIIDAAMVGAVGYKQLAAASLVINTMNIPFVLGIGITISVSQMVSMAHGRDDKPQVSHYLYNGFWLCTVSAVLIALVLVGGRNVLLHMDQDPEVARMALPFMTLVGLSIIPMLLFMTLKQFADGLEHTRTAMTFSLLSIPINVLLNWLLIFGNWGFPHLGLVGAGWATFITRTLMFIMLLVVILKHRTFSEYITLRHHQWRLRSATLRELLGIGIPSAMQVGLEAGAFAVTGILMGTISAVAQAAHQIALSCASFTFMVSMGLSQAGSIRASNAFGRTDWMKISVIGRSTLLMALGYGIFCAIAFALFRNDLALLFNKNGEVVALASFLMLFAAVFQISDATQAVGAGLLRGIKDVRTPTWLIGIAYWVVGLPLGLLLAFTFHTGAAGMWAGFIAGLTFASVGLMIRFVRMTRRAVRA